MFVSSLASRDTLAVLPSAKPLQNRAARSESAIDLHGGLTRNVYQVDSGEWGSDEWHTAGTGAELVW